MHFFPKNNKTLPALIILFVFLFGTINVSAHTGTACNSGSESAGWIVNCSNHAGKTYYTFTFASDLPTVYKNYTNTGVARWNNTSIVSIQYAVLSDNLVTSYGGPDTGTVAIARSWANPTTGHKTRWEISYNRYVMGNRTSVQNNGTATHELGHTIGLADLKTSTNSNKLMYQFSTRSVFSPTSSDRTGAINAVK